MVGRGCWKYLVSPQQLVATSVLEAIPDVQELCDPVCPDVIGVLFGLIPGERCAERQETHGAERGADYTETVCPCPEKRVDIAARKRRDDKLLSAQCGSPAGLTQLWCKSGQLKSDSCTELNRSGSDGSPVPLSLPKHRGALVQGRARYAPGVEDGCCERRDDEDRRRRTPR